MDDSLTKWRLCFFLFRSLIHYNIVRMLFNNQATALTELIIDILLRKCGSKHC